MSINESGTNIARGRNVREHDGSATRVDASERGLDVWRAMHAGMNDQEDIMADPRDLGKGAGDPAEDASREVSSPERSGGDPRDSASGSSSTSGGDQPRDRASRRNIRGTLREMNREAGGVGGGLANMTGGDGGCLRRMLPIVLIIVVIVVVLIILGSMG